MTTKKPPSDSSKEPHYKVDFGFNPYALQREIIDHLDGKILNNNGEPYRFICAVLGRQSGKSWLARFTLLDRAINRGQNCMWVAPAIPSARSHWNKLVKLIKESKLPVKRISQAAKEIHFFGGGIISIRSAIEPDNLRGDSLDYIVLDEAAFYRNGEYVWQQVVMPMITSTRGNVLFTTTPNGRNWFYNVFRRGLDPKNRYYKSWQIPSTSSPYQDVELLEEIRLSMPTNVWREEYLAEFLADGGGVFSGVEQASTVHFMLKNPLEGHEYVMGIDFGHTNDPTCITVIDKHERRQVYGKRLQNIGTIPVIKQIIEHLDHWQPTITHIEKNGVGESLLTLLKEVLAGNTPDDIVTLINERLQDDPDATELERNEVVGGHKIRAVHSNNEIKRAIIERAAADIEYGRFFLLSDQTTYGDIQLGEISTFERTRTPSGQSTYKAAEGAHDDTVITFCVAYMGVPKPKFRRPQKKRSKSDGKNPFRSSSTAISKHRKRSRE